MTSPGEEEGFVGRLRSLDGETTTGSAHCAGAMQTALWVRGSRSLLGARNRRILLNVGNGIETTLFRRVSGKGWPGRVGNLVRMLFGVQGAVECSIDGEHGLDRLLFAIVFPSRCC